MSPKQSRSPLRDKPLRLPGQSVTEERDDLVNSAMEQPTLLALFMVMLAALEWWRLYTKMQPNPVIFSAVAAITVVYAAYRLFRALPKLRALRQALEGERAVGQFLERLREQGYQVFHDIVGTGFNVDHVIVGPTGAYTIETKTWSKPLRGDSQISFDGDTLKVGGLEPDRDPIIQAKAQASWLRSVLLESTGRKIDVRPVVVFPGWFIVNKDGAFRSMWVLEPKALPTFLMNEPVRLSPEDVKLASFHLSRMIRDSQRKR
jgi:type II secretory pathway pseudopilin PulG